MTFGALREAVLNPELCTSCGACELVCPADVIGFDGLEPVLRTDDWTDADCRSCSDCLDVCPGADPGTAESEVQLFGHTRSSADRWLGIRRRIVGGFATDPAIFAASASGGSITALLDFALTRRRADAVLSMGRSGQEPWRAMPAVSRDPAALLETAQSTYQLAPYLGALRPLRLECPDERVAVVGVACHVQAIRILQRLDTAAGQWARDRIVLLVEPACSSGTPPSGTASVITNLMNLPLADVTRLRFREGDYPGAVHVRTVHHQNHELEFWKAVRHFSANKTHRCLSCGDWMSGLADVSVSDGDPNIFDSSIRADAAAKHGRVYVRTAVGDRMVDEAVAAGVLHTWDIELTGMNLGLERKRNRRARYERSGRPVPLGPIRGYRENTEIVSDEELLAVRRTAATSEEPDTSPNPETPLRPTQ